MADTTVDVASLTNALNQSYAQLVSVRNDAVPFLSWIRKERNTTGKNVSWAFKTGTSLGAYIAEGVDQAAFDTNTKLPATLNTAEYSEGVHLTQKAINAAYASSGPEGLVNLVAEEFQDSVNMLAKKINPEIIAGHTSSAIVGLYYSTTGALAASGTYAGLDRGTYPQLAANIFNNPLSAGVLRTLELAVMRKARTGIFDASGRKPSALWMPPQVLDKYIEINDARRRDAGAAAPDVGNSADAPRAHFDGIPMFEDSDWTDNQLIMCDTPEMSLVYQPDVNTPMTTPAGYVQIVGTPESQGMSGGTGLMARVNRLSQQGNAHRFQIIVELQMKVKRANSFGVVNDILTD